VDLAWRVREGLFQLPLICIIRFNKWLCLTVGCQSGVWARAKPLCRNVFQSLQIFAYAEILYLQVV